MKGVCDKSGRPLFWAFISLIFAIVCLGFFLVALDINNKSLIYLFAIGGLVFFKTFVILCIFWCISKEP